MITYLIGKLGVRERMALQKCTYFAEAVGVETGASFRMHLFGPYSREVALEYDELVARGVLACDPKSQMLNLGPAGETVLQVAEKELGEAAAELDAVAEWLQGLSASELELHGTVHFVASWSNAVYGSSDRDRVLERVNRLKGDRFSEEEIKRCYDWLRQRDLLPEKALSC